MRWTNPIKRSLAAAALAASPFGTPLLAQEVTSELDPSELIETGDTMVQSNVGFGNRSFFVAPVPRATPTLGNSVYLLGGYIFQADPGSRTSFLGVGTMFNENGSDLNAVGGRLSLFDRKLQVRFGIGEGELFYDTFVGNFAVPVKQEVTGYLLSLGYGVRDDLTIGVIGRYTDSVISPDAGALPPDFPIQDVELEVGRAGVFAEYETTDNDVFPRTGWRVNLSADWGSASGSEDFSTALGLFDYYLPFREKDALAMRLALCGSSESTPYFVECSIGRSDKFRGFEFFRFGGEALASFQAEYRGRLENRFGYSVYGGFGSTGGGFSDLSDGGAAIGGGLRYQLTRDFPLDLALDVTYNSEDEVNAYFTIGQGF